MVGVRAQLVHVKRGHIIEIARNTKLFTGMQEGDLLLLDFKKAVCRWREWSRAAIAVDIWRRGRSDAVKFLKGGNKI